jgi:hypothetical protein
MNIRVSDIAAQTVGRIEVAHVSISLGEGVDAFEAVRDLNFAWRRANSYAFSVRPAAASRLCSALWRDIYRSRRGN